MDTPRKRWIRSPQPSPRGGGFTLGIMFLAFGLVFATKLLVSGPFDEGDIVLDSVLVGGLFVIAVPLLVRGALKGRRAAFLQEQGVELVACVTDAVRTGIEFGNIPLFRLTLEVEGEDGPYSATADEVLPPEDVAAAIGSTVRVRVHPAKRDEVVITRV